MRPICFAVFRLTTNSNFVGCSTGKSLGLAPLRILSTKYAEAAEQGRIRPIRHKAADLNELPPRGDRRQPVLYRKFHDPFLVGIKERVSRLYDGAASRPRCLLERALESVEGPYLPSSEVGDLAPGSQVGFLSSRVWNLDRPDSIAQRRGRAWGRLFKQLQPLTA